TAERDLYSYRPPALAALAGAAAPRVYAFDYFEAGTGRRYLGHEGYVMKVLREDRPAWAEAAALRTALYPSVLGGWGVETAFAVDALGLYPPYLEAVTRLRRRYEETPLHTRLLRLAAVTHVVALHRRGLDDLTLVGEFPSLFVEPIHVFRVPEPLPRARVVDGVRVAGEEGAFAALVDPAFDPWREVVLTDGRPVAPESSFRGAATVVASRPGRVVVQAELSRAGHLVLADAYHPGWRVEVDGRRAEVLRANGAFRAVALEPGRHHVELSYRPASVVAGVLATGATLALLAAAAAVDRRRRGRKAAAP
ncbi:MAG TPA: YfhO family protein, partial [Vicinamibacteria bacterium]|nr:YfhO family protein [Vicinamibacteria bacterium]